MVLTPIIAALPTNGLRRKDDAMKILAGIKNLTQQKRE